MRTKYHLIALLSLTIIAMAGCSTKTGPNVRDGHLLVRVFSGERGSNPPIVGAKVTISETGQSLLTDESGLAAFRLPVYTDGSNPANPMPAYYTFSVAMPGFTTEIFQDAHAFEGPLDDTGDTAPDPTTVYVYLVLGQGENRHQIPCLDGSAPPCSPPALLPGIHR